MMVGFKTWLGVSGVAFASVDIMSDVPADEDLQLLQVAAGRHQQDVELNITGGLSPEDTQGPYTVNPPGVLCSEDQVLTVRQCAEAAWSNQIPIGNQALATYGAINAANGPKGCFYSTRTKGVYYNAGDTKANPNVLAVCGVAANINGGRAREEQEIGNWTVDALPFEVEHLPANTLCEDCGLLTLDQCAIAIQKLGLEDPHNKAALSNGPLEYWPYYYTWQNPQRFRNPPHTNGPKGCYTQQNNPRHKVVYWMIDKPGDEFVNAPNPKKRPICRVCPTTTTTTTPEPTTTTTTTTTTPEPTTTTAATLAPTTTGDSASAVDDPHVKTVQGVKYDVAH